jgi:hypothetical protein
VLYFTSNNFLSFIKLGLGKIRPGPFLAPFLERK